MVCVRSSSVYKLQLEIPSTPENIDTFAIFSKEIRMTKNINKKKRKKEKKENKC